MKHLLILMTLVTVSCSNPPKKEDLAYLEHQVYQCKMVCTSGAISNLKIAELGCDCKTNKEVNQPIIIMPQAAQQPIIINNATGAGYATPARSPATTTEVVEEVVETPTHGVQVKLSNGRTLYSSAK